MLISAVLLNLLSGYVKHPTVVLTFETLGVFDEVRVRMVDLQVKLDGLQEDALHRHHLLLGAGGEVITLTPTLAQDTRAQSISCVRDEPRTVTAAARA